MIVFFHLYERILCQRLFGKDLLTQVIIHVLFVYNTGVTLTHISLASFLWDIGEQCRPSSNAADFFFLRCFHISLASFLLDIGE